MTSPVKLWRNQGYISTHLGKKGVVVSWTRIHVPPKGFSDQAPYLVALVRLESGERVVCQLVDWNSSEISIGHNVELVVRRVQQLSEDGVIPYGIKARPIQ